MDPVKIKEGHCYSVRLKNRNIIARVVQLFPMTLATSNAEHAAASNTAGVRFVWRHAAYPRGWSATAHQVPLTIFASTAQGEVNPP
jgi:hypothetical protein